MFRQLSVRRSCSKDVNENMTRLAVDPGTRLITEVYGRLAILLRVMPQDYRDIAASPSITDNVSQLIFPPTDDTSLNRENEGEGESEKKEKEKEREREREKVIQLHARSHRSIKIYLNAVL